MEMQGIFTTNCKRKFIQKDPKESGGHETEHAPTGQEM